jgi:S1-C subfamily serine protease
MINVAEKVSPSVVSLNVTTAQGQGQGSGFVYAADGKIVTNHHVVNGARSIQVVFSDGRRLAGRVLGSDAGFDLAVVQVEATNLPVLPLAESGTLKVGQFVVAIGNPLGYDQTVTTGVISALNRPISDQGNAVARAMHQTDAAINPGNSGGPLVTLDGKVAGVNTQIALTQGATGAVAAQGLGFAVPATTVKTIAPQLIQFGRVQNSGRAYLGVSVGQVTQALADAYRLPSQSGAVVSSVVDGAPAATAGLRAQDIIVSLDGQAVFGSDKLIEALIVRQPGETIRLEVVREGGQKTTISVRLGEAPATAPAAPRTPVNPARP